MNESQKALVEALRSGEYKQTKYALCKTNGEQPSYCCLGVACEVYQKTVGGLTLSEVSEQRVYNGRAQDLPLPVKEWLGFHDSIGQIDELKQDELLDFLKEKGVDVKDWNTDTLAELNDNGVSFEVIADIIEKDFVQTNVG